MKRIFIFFCVCILSYRLFYSHKVEVKHSFSTSFDNANIERITVILNQPFLYDEDKIEKEIIERYYKNSFNEIKFTHNHELLSKLYVTVYLTKHDYRNNKIAFEIEHSKQIIH